VTDNQLVTKQKYCMLLHLEAIQFLMDITIKTSRLLLKCTCWKVTTKQF